MVEEEERFWFEWRREVLSRLDYVLIIICFYSNITKNYSEEKEKKRKASPDNS